MNIEKIKKDITHHLNYVPEMSQSTYNALKGALDIINALEQEPCEDAVSRQAVLMSIKNLYPDMPIMDIMGARRKWLEKYAPYFECENEIERLPSVNPQEPKKGHWIEKDGYDGDIYYDCSECGESFCLIDGTPTDNLYSFCPNCGARMESIEGV